MGVLSAIWDWVLAHWDAILTAIAAIVLIIIMASSSMMYKR